MDIQSVSIENGKVSGPGIEKQWSKESNKRIGFRSYRNILSDKPRKIIKQYPEEMQPFLDFWPKDDKKGKRVHELYVLYGIPVEVINKAIESEELPVHHLQKTPKLQFEIIGREDFMDWVEENLIDINEKIG